jgi:hypothetical protein
MASSSPATISAGARNLARQNVGCKLMLEQQVVADAIKDEVILGEMQQCKGRGRLLSQ